MNISKINPIGYEAKTENGNSYKRSNMYKTAGLTAAAVINVAAETSNNSILKTFSGSSTFKSIAEEFNVNIPKMLKIVIFTAGILLDLSLGYIAGRWIDNSINKKRAEKADKCTN